MPGHSIPQHHLTIVFGMVIAILLVNPTPLPAALLAGVAKVDVTERDAGPVNDPLFVKALVLRDGDVTAAMITIDAVAIGEIGYINNEYLPKVRAALQKSIGLDPKRILINASHCHGRVCADVAERTIAAVEQASKNLVPVRVGAGRGHENRVMENRRLKLKSGREADVRHAYSLPPDDEVVGAGPIDPDIGLLRLDRMDGRTLAIVYNFACHPIQGVPSGGNTADMTGFASQVLEDSFGDGAVALFLQGCGGDVNPIRYKQVDEPRDAEPLGNQLGLSAMRAAKKIVCRDNATLRWINDTLAVPRADNAERIAAVEAEQTRLLQSLKGTSLNLKTFLPLVVKQELSHPFPSYYSHRYLHEQKIKKNDLERLDAENRKHVEDYIKNITTMEELTRLQINLALLKRHQARNVAAGSRTLDTEVVGVRVADFSLVSFPGELTVQIGLNIKQAAGEGNTFVAGYSNGYIYYAPTAEQLRNVGGAQEDSDCMLAPEWQALFEAKALDVLRRLK
jgi:hypothetical protein